MMGGNVDWAPRGEFSFDQGDWYVETKGGGAEGFTASLNTLAAGGSPCAGLFPQTLYRLNYP